MNLHTTFPFLATLALSFPAAAIGEPKVWHSAQHSCAIPYESDTWSIAERDADEPPQTVLTLKHRDGTTRVRVKVNAAQPGMKLDETMLQRFADFYTKPAATAGGPTIVNWTTKDFTGDTGCIYEALYAAPKPGFFHTGRLAIHGNYFFHITASGSKSTDDARDSGVALMRAFHFE